VMFDVPELDGVVRDLGARGVAVGPIEAVPYGRMAKLEDPEGNVLEVHQPDSARGEGEAT